MRLLEAAAFVAASAVASTAAAQVVYDNSVGGPAGVTTGLVSDSSVPQAAADGLWFQIDQPVTGIEWTGLYGGGDATPPADDNFVINIRSDNAGAPGAILQTFPVGNSATRTLISPTGGTLTSVYVYTADISFTFLNSIDYWIEIDNDNGLRDDDTWSWATGPTGTGGSVWFSSNQGANWFDSTFPGADFRLINAATQCLADTNNDGDVTPADFNAWILAFNTGAPECDQNGDQLCTPADFNAWILNFNAGCP